MSTEKEVVFAKKNEELVLDEFRFALSCITVGLCSIRIVPCIVGLVKD